MAAAHTDGPRKVSHPSDSAFVCPICGRRFEVDRDACSRCGSNLVVPVEDGSVYETILAMCGCSSQPQRPRR